MKKITAVILVAGILFSLCACGNKSTISRIETEPQATEAEEITVAEIEETVTETETETETTAEETTTKLDLSMLSTAYIKAPSSGGKISFYEKNDEKSEVIATLSDGAEVKIIGKEGGWYHIYSNGKTGYVKAEYITDKKPVAFSRGYLKDGVYYNEWANLKIASPESWSKETYDRPYKLELFKTNPDDSYEAGITLYAVEGPVDLIFKEMAIEDSSTIKRESETAVFAGEKYYVWDYYQKTASGFDVFGMFSDYCVRYYYREFDGYSIVISVISTPTNEMDAYTSYISKIK